MTNRSVVARALSALVASSVCLTLPALAQEKPVVTDEGAINPEAAARAFPKRGFSPYAGRNYPTRVFWGHQHVHTGWSADAGAKAKHIAGLGIDRFIDISTERFEDVVENVDVVLDYIGGEITERSYTVLKSGGRYVTSMSLQTAQEDPEKRGFKSVGFGAVPRADLPAQIADQIDAGKLKVFVNKTFPLAEAQAAMDYRYMSKVPGKVVLTII